MCPDTKQWIEYNDALQEKLKKIGKMSVEEKSKRFPNGIRLALSPHEKRPWEIDHYQESYIFEQECIYNGLRSY